MRGFILTVICSLFVSTIPAAARKIENWPYVAALSIDRVHVHILAQFPARNPRHYVGLAKKESSAYMRRDGLAPYGGLWARSCECKPIVDGTHHHNVLNYIIDHGEKGAVVWSTPPVTKLEIDIDPDSLLVE